MARGKKDKRAGIGRSAACKVCNPAPAGKLGDPEPGCACLVDCGAPGCSGRESDHQAPMDYGRNTPQHPHPKGYQPPKYDGPRGKA